MTPAHDAPGRRPFWKTPRGRIGLVGLGLLVLGVSVWLGWRQGGAGRKGRPARRTGAAETETEVLYVQDGDTLRIRLQGTVRVIRLAGIDAPELGQEGGKEARRYLHELVDDAPISFRPGRPVGMASGRSPTWDEAVDKYGRNLGHAFLADGRSVEHELVRAGWAWRFPGFARDPALPGLEAEARKARRGIWAEDRPTPPWDWREDEARRDSR